MGCLRIGEAYATLDAALEIGRSADRYNQAIGKLAHRIADAMRFLAEDKKATDLRGRTITTVVVNNSRTQN